VIATVKIYEQQTPEVLKSGSIFNGPPAVMSLKWLHLDTLATTAGAMCEQSGRLPGLPGGCQTTCWRGPWRHTRLTGCCNCTHAHTHILRL